MHLHPPSAPRRPARSALPLSWMATAVLLCAATAHAQTVFVGEAGKSQAFSNLQDSIALNYYYPSTGIFPGNNEAFGYTQGMVHITAGTTVPYGMRADGRSLGTSANSALYALLGTTYGGNGANFNLPNLTSRTVVGAATRGMQALPGDMNWAPGQTGGTANITLLEANLPSHVHKVALPPSYTLVPTKPSGLGLPFSNVQPSLGMGYFIATSGDFPLSSANSDYGFTLGMVLPFAGTGTLTGGFMPADGRLLPIQNYGALFSVLGTTYGGNGTTNFALPDLRGRTVVGAGERPGATFGATLGQAFGANSHVLTLDEMPAHFHTADSKQATDIVGGTGRFDNTQSSLALNYLISVSGPKATGTDQDNGSAEFAFLGDVIAFAGGNNPSNIPGGFLLADGRSLKISDYTALYEVIGRRYEGNKPFVQNSFYLPDLRGRTVIGAAYSGGVGQSLVQSAPSFAEDAEVLETFALGDTPGNTLPELTVDNLAMHAPEISAVPEPASGLLAALGGLLVALRVKRQRRLAAV